jgi:hypothetical protein
MTSEYSGKKSLSEARSSFFKLFLWPLLFLLASCSGADKTSLTGEAKLASREQAHLKAYQAQLAAGKDFYVELSVRDKELRICHSGVFLRKYKVNDIRLENQRFFFIGKGGPKRWNNKLFKGGEFSPPQMIERIKIIPGDESTRPSPDKPGIIPPTMEEIITVPSSYILEFPKGFALKFDLKGEVPGKALQQKKTSLAWNDFLVSLGLRKGPAVRLKLEMDAKEGAAFFRSCPKNPSLLILP